MQEYKKVVITEEIGWRPENSEKLKILWWDCLYESGKKMDTSVPVKMYIMAMFTKKVLCNYISIITVIWQKAI